MNVAIVNAKRTDSVKATTRKEERLESTDYIGPGRVLEVRGKQALISAADHKAWALMALGYDYEPNVGDVLLVIGKQQSWYVIGVIEGSGELKWTVPHDLEINAPRGEIRLSAAQGISLRTPNLDLVSKKLRVVASSLIERFVNVQRTISDALDVHAGRVRVNVERAHRITAGRILHRAEGDVKLNGRKIHLG
ncbi:MAG: DUF3540 domain-containing protein [Gammaproteobacteria bacterium]|nr:DUF3540 domain-containing protein [Gammaproteobacteria bacterium]MDH3468065.1 DUF3540 domain-containing protein [Gammaproteobacteria bacterium]